MNRRCLIGCLLACVVGMAACQDDEATRATEQRAARTGRRNLDELQRLSRTPRACVVHADCPIGSHCDGDAGRCAWACIADSECGSGGQCDLYGSCVAAARVGSGPIANVANNTPACQLIPAGDRRDALLALWEDAQNQEFITCADDEVCPCGSYCSVDSVCAVDCLGDNPTPELTCPAGKSCTPLGRCATAANDPGPPLALTIALSDVITRANTASAAVVMPLTVTVSAISLDVLSPTNPALVKFTIAEVRDFQQGRVDDPPALAPRLRCASSAPFGSDCTINGGWTFNVAAGQLRSAPKTIWVEIPQTTTAQRWTLEARSEWAADPAIDVIEAAPVIIPATDPGHYRGTLVVPNAGAAIPADSTFALPVEAVVTATHVAIFEPTRLVLPDGHAVLSRDAAKSTLLGWLNAGTPRYDVALHLSTAAYNPATGHLDLAIAFATGTGADSAALSVALDRSGDADAPACPCGTGSYCNAAMARCLPGSGPPAGGGIVNAASAIPSSVLPSTTLAAWRSPLAAVKANNAALLSGTGIAGIERAYCFEATNQAGPARFGATPSLQPSSGDLRCQRGGAVPSEYPQTTFAYQERDREYIPGAQGGASFDLFESCLGDLDAQPTGNLLGARECASLARFFLAMNANVGANGTGQPLPDVGQRLVGHVLRQWLGLHSYVAGTATGSRAYDDALSVSSAPAHERLGSIVDAVDQGLRVLLDPAIRPQYTAGPALSSAVAWPDYRRPPRPVVRWTFNQATTPVPDAEGSANELVTTGVDLSGQRLNASGAAPRTCASAQPIGLPDRQFSITADVTFWPHEGATKLLDKLAPNGDRLWLEIKQAGTDADLALKDSHGGVARFRVPWFDFYTFNGLAYTGNGLITIVADGSEYRAYRGTPAFGNTAVVGIVEGGGPRWGAAGIVQLGCDGLGNNGCTSWDRDAPGDGLDVALRPAFVDYSPDRVRTCTTPIEPPRRARCVGPIPSDSVCASQRPAHRNRLIQGLFPNPPAAAVAALTVAGGTAEITDVGESDDGEVTTTWTSWRCVYEVTSFPDPITAEKPVCGRSSIVWDEVSLWSHAVQLDEFTAMAARYNGITSNESLPPADLTPLPSKEQATGLPAHLVEAASADLELLAAYIEAERGVMYEECYLGGTSSARDRVAARAGKNLRLVAILEAEATRLAGLPGVADAPWYPRYLAGRRELAGRRTRAVKQLQLAGECKNPLGITEDHLPLYVGEEAGVSNRFFASSRFLATKAKEEIALAQGKLSNAQNKYVEQRQSAYQLNQARDSKQLRETKLRSDFESALIRHCGKPAGTQKLLDGFLAGTITPSNCFIKTELPQCQNLGNTELASAPAACFRGDIGARLIGIQSAAVDVANANATLARTTDQYNADMVYCARRQQMFNELELILEEHYRHMQSLRAVEATRNNFIGLLNGAIHLDVKTVVDSVAGLSKSLGVGIGIPSNTLHQQKEAEDYQRVLMARSHDLDLAECYHKVDNEKFSIDAAGDVIQRASQEMVTAAFQLENSKNALAGLIDEAAGQLAIEQGIDSTPPHLHYWLDEEISAYHRHLAYARRLTYLALRAFEYEAQQSIGRRGDTLTARRPEDLLAVVTAIEQRNAPMQGETGLVIGGGPVALSLRDEILRILDVANGTQPLPGEPPVTPEQAFKRFLASDSSKILDSTGRYIGRGVRFSLRPAAWTETSCAERIWRVTPSLQIDNPPTQHGMVLYQENAFGSQDCRGEFGDVLMSRAESSVNLLVGDIASFATPSSYTAMNIDGPLNLDHESLRARPEGDLSGFAGHGLYSNYILLFPPQTWPDVQIAKIKDVLLRFDIVELTHAPL